MDVSAPRSLKDAQVVAERRERWLTDSALGPLRDYVGGLLAGGRSVPAFDPDDAGVAARVLFVLEAPGPMSAAGKGSGFISPDNNDQTAANIWHARNAAGLVQGALHTNLTPWYLGAASVKPKPVEVAEGAVQLWHLLDLLPELRVVVLCGEYARRGWRTYTAGLIDGPGPVVIETHHPSPQGLIQADRRDHFMASVRRAATLSVA